MKIDKVRERLEAVQDELDGMRGMGKQRQTKAGRVADNRRSQLYRTRKKYQQLIDADDAAYTDMLDGILGYAEDAVNGS